MPFDGMGVFTRIYSWVNDAATGVKINATRTDTDSNDIATGLSNCVTRDGQSPATANTPMGGFRHTGVDDGVARDDYPSIGQIQDNGLVWCGTAGGTGDVITIAATPVIAAYVTGMRLAFVTSAANTTAVTVNLNAIGAKSLKKMGTVALNANDILSGQIVEILYDGTQFQVVSPAGCLDTTTANIGIYTEKLNAVGSTGGSVTADFSLGRHYSITMTSNTTFTFSNPGVTGTAVPYVFYLKQDGTGSRTVTWPASVKWPSGIAPTLTTTAGRTDEIVLISRDGGTSYSGSIRGLNLNI